MKLYKVAKIISNQKLVITGGAKDGIKHGDEFWIIGYGEIIIDPDTNKELDALEHVRGKGKAVHVQHHITTIESNLFVRKQPTSRTINPLWSGLNLPEGIEERLVPFDDPQIGDHAYPVDDSKP